MRIFTYTDRPKLRPANYPTLYRFQLHKESTVPTDYFPLVVLAVLTLAPIVYLALH
jgi:hypothetical protein